MWPIHNLLQTLWGVSWFAISAILLSFRANCDPSITVSRLLFLLLLSWSMCTAFHWLTLWAGCVTVGMVRVSQLWLRFFYLFIFYNETLSLFTEKDRGTDRWIRQEKKKNTVQPAVWSSCQFFHLSSQWKRENLIENDPNKSEFRIITFIMPDCLSSKL